MFDLDTIDDWFSPQSKVLTPHLPPDFIERVRKANPRYIENARDVVLGLGDKDWIRSETVLAYHGTRLTPAELESVRARGLMPLQALARRERLIGALSSHPSWPQVENQLEGLLQERGPKAT
jgi:hypothetical protein